MKQRQRLGLRASWWIRGAAAMLGLGGLLASAVQAPSAVGAADPPADASPMDEPLRLLAEANSSFANVTDYTCTLIKKESINGVMMDQVMDMSVRNDPFSVYLRWLGPRDKVGQEACYVAGRNDGKMRVKSSGLIGVVGFVSIEPTDPRAMKTSRHAITEAGIGNLLQRLSTRWEIERKLNVTQVKIGEYEYNKRRCVRVETTHTANPDNQFFCYRAVIYFDKETHLPIRAEAYDWPTTPGDAKGTPMETASYTNLQLNVGLPDDTFNK